MKTSWLITNTFLVVMVIFVRNEASRSLHQSLQRQQGEPQDCLATDIVFILDYSGSVNVEDWTKVLKFSADLIQGLDVGPDATRVAVLPYNNGTTVFLDNPYTAAELSQIIQQLPKEDEKTDTSSALKKMRESIFSMDRGDRPGYRDIGIIITDGSSEVPGQELTIPVEVEPNDDGIAMIALGIGPQANSKVQALASSPEQGLILTDSELEMMKKDLIDIICNHVSVGNPLTSPTTPPN